MKYSRRFLSRTLLALFSVAVIAASASRAAAQCPTPTPTPAPTPNLTPLRDVLVATPTTPELSGSPGDTVIFRGSLANTSDSAVQFGWGLIFYDAPGVVCVEGNAPQCPTLGVHAYLQTDPLPAHTSTGDVNFFSVQFNPDYTGPLPVVMKYRFYVAVPGQYFSGLTSFTIRLEPREDASRPPVLLTDPCTGHASALDSVTMTPGPFALENPWNLSPDKADQRTRVALYVWNLRLLAGEDESAVSVRAVDSAQKTYSLPVEFVDYVAGGPTRVIVRLPDGLPAEGDLSVSVAAHGLRSNEAVVSLRQATGDGP